MNANDAAFSSLGMIVSSLDSATLPLKKPAKSNVMALPPVVRPAPPWAAQDKPVKGNVAASPSHGLTGFSLGGAIRSLSPPLPI